MNHLRATLACIVTIVCLATLSFAQSSSIAVKSPSWSLGVFAVAGTGIQQDSDIQNFGIGGRFGRVLMHERGPGFLRGTLEWNGEVLPFHQFYGRGETATGAIVNPLVAKWNFTRSSKAPLFFEAIGGVIFTNKNFPPGDTAQVNFNSGAGLGINIFRGEKRSIAFDTRALHLSNASIGNHNPGVNASIQFTVGYTWWK